MKYGELRWPDIAEMDKTHKVVVLPLGSFEQHGQHCPLLTDTMIGGEVASQLEAALPGTVILAPVQWLGSSDHHLKFPGTLSVPSDFYIEMVMHLCECVISAGFQRIFLLLSHGGNDVPCMEVLQRLAMKHRDRDDLWLASSGWWAVGADGMRLPEMRTARPTHACEYETSMMLALRSDLVRMDLAKGEQPWIESKYYFPDLTTIRPSKVNVSLPFERMTSIGAMGRPDLADPDKGRKLFEGVSQHVIDFVREFAHWPKPRQE